MKIKNTEATLVLRGVEFPQGKPVDVEDEGLAAKCLAMPQFVRARARKNGKDED